jgi:hypothetical protein
MSATVQYSGHKIYKSTLVSRVHNYIFFNNSDDYLVATNSENSCLLGVGSDCIMYFVRRNTTRMTYAAKSAMKRTRGRASSSGRPMNVLQGVDEGTWWLERVPKMRRKVGTK